MADTIFYDGSCALCHFWVRFVRKRAKGKFNFEPIGSWAWKERLPTRFLRIDSVVLAKGTHFYAKSSAVCRILWQCGWFWALLGGLFWLMPRVLRDLVYDLVAIFRYRLFGRFEPDVCSLEK